MPRLVLKEVTQALQPASSHTDKDLDLAENISRLCSPLYLCSERRGGEKQSNRWRLSGNWGPSSSSPIASLAASVIRFQPFGVYFLHCKAELPNAASRHGSSADRAGFKLRLESRVFQSKQLQNLRPRFTFRFDQFYER